jgi:hypothetical protein
MPMTPADRLAAYRTAWLERDADAAATLFTEDATHAEQPYQAAARAACRSLASR